MGARVSDFFIKKPNLKNTCFFFGVGRGVGESARVNDFFTIYPNLKLKENKIGWGGRLE